jgi:hypothetical protein
MNVAAPWQDEYAERYSLDGAWAFSLAGQTGAIQVPGVWEAQGFARDVEGPAVYERSIDVPAAWSGRRVQLQFGAASYHLTCEVNGELVGSHAGMWAPFAFDVTDALRPGETNTIRLAVYKPGERYPVREVLAGFLPDVCFPFGGIWQTAMLAAFSGPAISDLWIHAHLDSCNVDVSAALHGADGHVLALRVFDPDGRLCVEHRPDVEAGSLHTALHLDTVRAWSPAQPNLYTLEVTLEAADGMPAARTRRRFGFRALSHAGEQLLFNDRPVCLRGLLNWGWYPEALCPAPDEATIRDEFRRVRDMGFNMIKLCLVVPSPLYFDLADEMGMFLWLELPMWLPQVTERLRAQAPGEYRDILREAHSHPSIVLYSLGCELGDNADAALLGQLDDLLRRNTNGILACDNSGSGEAYGGLSFDYADFNDYHFYCDLHYFTPLVDHFRRDWRPPRPWIFGEFNDMDDYRDLDEIAAAFAGDLPWWYTARNPIHAEDKLSYHRQDERIRELDLGLGFDGQALQRISRAQSFVIRKHILEKVRARAGMGGYVVTGLRDTPLATSAVFDDLARAKYPAEAFRHFNTDSVLLLEQGRARRWINGGDRPTPRDLHNHVAGAPVSLRLLLANTEGDVPAQDIRWRLLDPDGAQALSGDATFPAAPGLLREIARLDFNAPSIEHPAEYTLEAELGHLRNTWPLWFYPPVTDWPGRLAMYDPAGTLAGLDDLIDAAVSLPEVSAAPNDGDTLLITSVFTPAIDAFVRSGGHALYLNAGAGGLPVIPCPFWRESVKLLYDHPVLADFPHRGHADLEFYNLATDHALDTAGLKRLLHGEDGLAPILRRLDARLFTTSEYLVELRMGRGALLASTLRFWGGAGDQVAGLRANPAGRWLLRRILEHMHRLASPSGT